MRTIGELLGSTARTETLRVLAHCCHPLGLRPLARLARVHPHSVEMALPSLLEEGLVQRLKSGGRPLYRRVASHPDWAVLEAVFEAAERAFIRRRSEGLQQRARRILPFIDEANRMLEHARKHGHVT